MSECLTLALMRDALGREFAGFDLSPDNANLLLNEGHRELVARSEWLRGALALTQNPDGSFQIPTTIARVRSIASAGVPLEQTTDVTGLELQNGTATQSGSPVWWPQMNDTGTVESISVFPTPSEGSVVAQVSLYPPDLIGDDDEPATPCEYRRGIVSYAAAQAYGFVEDDRDLRDANMADFELAVTRLRAHRTTRFGAGPVRMRIAA